MITARAIKQLGDAALQRQFDQAREKLATAVDSDCDSWGRVRQSRVQLATIYEECARRQACADDLTGAGTSWASAAVLWLDLGDGARAVRAWRCAAATMEGAGRGLVKARSYDEAEEVLSKARTYYVRAFWHCMTARDGLQRRLRRCLARVASLQPECGGEPVSGRGHVLSQAH